ncbi:MAG TPA: glucosaminidase domain-containing protein [Bacteroidales bacterium]|nr:glucosaminidase domain-containing protein [Bacteroidales bacterium]HQB20562.1 glucosaminidase domain-containing protein [Bacteroidales bacterium]
MNPKDFFSKYGLAFINGVQGTGLYPSVKAAQAALETGYGKSMKIAGNNMFGIKADTSWRGPVVSNTTREVVNGVSQNFTGTGKIYVNRGEAIADGANIQTLFRAYPSISDSIKDHTDFLLKNKRYENVLKAKTPEEQCNLLQSAGYATATNYAVTLIYIINQYELKKLDEKKK